MKTLFITVTLLFLPFTVFANNGLNAVGKVINGLIFSALWILISLAFLAYYSSKRKKEPSNSPIPIYLSYGSLIAFFGYLTLKLLDNHRMPLFSKKMLNPSRYPEVKVLWLLLLGLIITTFFAVRFIKQEQNKKD